MVQLINFCQSIRYKITSFLVWISLTTCELHHLFICLLSFWVSSSINFLFIDFAHFSFGVPIFLRWYEGHCHILDISPLSGHCRNLLISHLPINFILWKEILKIYYQNGGVLIFFSFFALWQVGTKSFPTPRFRRCSPAFSSITFHNLAFLHLEFISCHGPD